jgi:hypothetical protein
MGKSLFHTQIPNQGEIHGRKQGGCFTLCGLCQFYINLKKYLLAKEEELGKTQIIFHHAKII